MVEPLDQGAADMVQNHIGAKASLAEIGIVEAVDHGERAVDIVRQRQRDQFPLRATCDAAVRITSAVFDNPGVDMGFLDH